MRRFIAFLMLLSFAPFTHAGPANAKHLPADAKWYLHLDVEAAKQTVLFETVLTAVKAQFPIDDVLAQLKAGIGVNPLTDISAITVYNNSFEKDVAAVVVYAKVDVGPLNNALAQNPDYKEMPYGKHTLLGWTDQNDAKPKTGCFYGDGIILMADKVDTLKLAVDTLDGAKPAGSALVKSTAEKGVFLSAAADLAHANDPNVAQLLSSAQPATASFSENDGKLQITVNLTAAGPEQAAQIKRMLDGVAAFGQIATQDVPTLAALLKQVTVVADGSKVIAGFQHDSKTLLQTLQKIDQENKARTAPKPTQPNGL